MYSSRHSCSSTISCYRSSNTMKCVVDTNYDRRKYVTNTTWVIIMIIKWVNYTTWIKKMIIIDHQISARQADLVKVNEKRTS